MPKPGYSEWRAQAELQRRFGLSPSAIRESMWRNQYLPGMTPIEAAKHTEDVNGLSVVDRRQIVRRQVLDVPSGRF